MPSLDADEKSWETWAFAEKRAFRPAERLNAADQLRRDDLGAASVRAVAIVGGVQAATWAGVGLVRTLGENDRHGCSWSGPLAAAG